MNLKQLYQNFLQEYSDFYKSEMNCQTDLNKHRNIR